MTPTETATAIAHADKMKATMEHLLGDGAIGAIHGLQINPDTDLPSLRLKIIDMVGGVSGIISDRTDQHLNWLDFFERYALGGVEAVKDHQDLLG